MKKKTILAAASAVLILCTLTGCKDNDVKVGAEQTASETQAVSATEEKDCCHKDTGCENEENCTEEKDCCKEKSDTVKDYCEEHESEAENTDSESKSEGIANCCG